MLATKVPQRSAITAGLAGRDPGLGSLRERLKKTKDLHEKLALAVTTQPAV